MRKVAAIVLVLVLIAGTIPAFAAGTKDESTRETVKRELPKNNYPGGLFNYCADWIRGPKRYWPPREGEEAAKK